MIGIPLNQQKSNLNARFNVFTSNKAINPESFIPHLDRYEFEIYKQVFWQLANIQQFMLPEHRCIWADVCGAKNQNTPDALNLVAESFKQHRNTLSANTNSTPENNVTPSFVNTQNPPILIDGAIRNITSIATEDPQGLVINAEKFDKTLVLASAGTGKTYSVIQRLLCLAKQNNGNLDHVLAVSFSRTARQELRKRVAEGLRNTNQNIGNLPNIRTLDSLTANLLNNQVNQAGHQDSIRHLISILKNGNPINNFAYAMLQPYSCLIVDEVQDIVGDRAELIIELVKQLKSVNANNFGLLLLGDLRQAIYNWQLAQNDNNSDYRTPFWLIKQLKEFLGTELKSIEFTTSWRFNNESMKHFVEKLKNAMDTQNTEPGEHPDLSNLSNLLIDTNNISSVDGVYCLKQIISQNPESKFALLARTTFEVCSLESVLFGTGIRVKPIFAGAGSGYPGWIGKFFLHLNAGALNNGNFNNEYNQCFNGLFDFAPPAEEAWAFLSSFTGDHIDIQNNLISQMITNEDEPSEIRLAPQSGELWISTVHQAKGREFDTVILHSKRNGSLSAPSNDEEARVAFVAATRAKSKIYRTKFGGVDWKFNGIDWSVGKLPFNNTDWLSWMGNNLLWNMFIGNQSLQLRFSQQNNWLLTANNAPNPVRLSEDLRGEILRYVKDKFVNNDPLNTIYMVRILDLRSRLSPDQNTIYHTPILCTELQI